MNQMNIKPRMGKWDPKGISRPISVLVCKRSHYQSLHLGISPPSPIHWTSSQAQLAPHPRWRGRHSSGHARQLGAPREPPGREPGDDGGYQAGGGAGGGLQPQYASGGEWHVGCRTELRMRVANRCKLQRRVFTFLWNQSESSVLVTCCLERHQDQLSGLVV